MMVLMGWEVKEGGVVIGTQHLCQGFMMVLMGWEVK